MNYWSLRKLASLHDEQLTQQHVDQARVEAEAAHDEVLRLVDPSHPRHQNFSRASERAKREVEDAERLARLARTQWQTLADRLEAKQRRERAMREEALHQRRVQAAEEAAREAIRQTALAQRQAAPAIPTQRTEVPMTETERLVQKRDAVRLTLLRRMYERSGARTNVGMDRHSLFEEIGVSPEEGMTAARWLIDEGLAGFMGTQNLRIEHMGIKEVEDSVRHPDRETKYFSPPVIHMVNNFQGATIGAVQTGADATANVQQNIGAPPGELAALLSQLREQAGSLPDPSERAEALEMVADLETEAAKEKKNERRIKALTTGLGTITALAPLVQAILKLWFGG